MVTSDYTQLHTHGVATQGKKHILTQMLLRRTKTE